jgi:hypothetical protein
MHVLAQMRLRLTIIIFLIFCTAVLRGQVTSQNDPTKYPGLTNTSFVDKIKGRPIEFYLGHKDIGLTAKLFYQGKFAISDDGGTFSFLDSLLTSNKETKPFYFFIYNQAMKITDGSVAEYMSGLCRTYLMKFPCDFLQDSKHNEYQVDLDKWTAFIGFDIYDIANFEKVMSELDKQVKNRCSTESTNWDKIKLKIKNNLEEK